MAVWRNILKSPVKKGIDEIFSYEKLSPSMAVSGETACQNSCGIYTRHQPLLAVLLPESFLKCWVRSLISTKTLGICNSIIFRRILPCSKAGYPKSLTTAAQSKRAVTGSLLHDVFRQLHVLKPRIIWVSTPKNEGVKVTWDDDIPNMMGK
jgi:hypothetical protein